METNHRISSMIVTPGLGRRLLQVLLLSGCFCLAAQGPALAGEKQDAREKISGVILAHQQQKIRPTGMTAARHNERLHRLGLNADVLDAEQTALYVDNPLTDDEIADLAEQGININVHAWVPAVPGKHAHGFYLASVKYDALDTLREYARVVFVETVESVSRPLNLAARAMTNADDVSSGSGVTAREGNGVHVAVLDSGFDLSHADLPVPVDAYDMTDGTDINSWGTDVSNQVMDHGMHVAGSVLGGGVLGAQHRGVATQVSWSAIKIGNDTDASASDSDIIEGFTHISSLVVSGKKVANLSYGSLVHIYMDGSSPVEQAIDNATANGVTCVIAAGNDQWSDRHASVSVPPGATSGTYSLLIDNTGGSAPYAGPEDLRVIWLDGVSDGNMVLTATNLGAGESLTNPWSGTSPRSTEAKQYILNINPIAAGASRTYIFTLQNTAGSGSTPLVHTYRGGGSGVFTNPDPFYTINHPATADTAIAVGAWTQADSWTDFQGNFWQYTWLTVNTLAPFSSLGPRIDGVQKPDIVAPGAVTISTKDSNTFGSPSGCDNGTGFPFNCLTIDNDGFNNGAGPADYYVHYGTSMAAPHAAGTVALMLEAAPTMTPAQVKAALVSTASNAGAPDNSVGSGLIDILAGIQSVDCDDNGVYDVTEVGDGSASDCDGNGRPDSCDLVSGAMSYDYVGYSAGSVPASVLAMADFDGDGELDAAMAMPGEGGNPIRFMWNNADGTFSAVNQYVDGTFWSIAYLAAGDFDQDGDADLVISMSSSVRILDNDGSGAFTLAGNLFGSIGDYRLSVIDLNLDTYPDLVYLRSWAGSDEFGVSLNNGDGTFPQPTVTNIADPAREVVFGDVDNDGDPDMIIAMGHNNTAGDVLVHLNQGDGSFATAIQYPVSGGPISLDVGDLDADGDLDVVVRSVIASGSSHWNSILDLLINDGTGSFTQPGGQNAPTLLATNLYAAPLIVADANGDLIPDIVVGGPGQHPDLGILVNDGNANFTLVPTTFSPWGPSTASAMVAEDFDSSGTMDFLVIEGGTVAALWGTATPPFDTDCNANGVPDSCEIGDGSAQDCQADGIPDDCQLAGNDCNGNGDPDDCDISGGGSSDNNGNGVPDECEGVNNCPADFDGDNDVDAADLAQVLGAWGPYGSCPPYIAQDFDQDCDVDAADLAQVLGAWGACP